MVEVSLLKTVLANPFSEFLNCFVGFVMLFSGDVTLGLVELPVKLSVVLEEGAVTLGLVEFPAKLLVVLEEGAVMLGLV